MNIEMVRALKLAVDCIEDVARMAGDDGAPSGIVFAALQAHGMTLNVYQQIIDGMTAKGRITVNGNLIRIAREI